MTKILYIPSGQYLMFANSFNENSHYMDTFTCVFEDTSYVFHGLTNFMDEFLWRENYVGIKSRCGVPEHHNLVIEEFEIIYE